MNKSKTFENLTLLKPSEVAKMLHVSPVTVRHWSLNGKLKHVTTVGGHRRYKLEDIENFVSDFKKAADDVFSILVIDDEELHARFIQEFLSHTFPQANISVASDGFSAANLMHRIRPDLVVLDLMMPGMDGVAVCEYIKQDTQTQNVPVIAMTGYPTKENIDSIIQAGAEVCLSKPICLDVMEKLVRKSMGIELNSLKVG